MFIHVLGSGAGGGFPQWNCNCSNCLGLRQSSLSASPRTQSSIAVSSNYKDWVLFNASPDIRQQLLSFPAFQPGLRSRDTGIKAIVITDAQIDHVAGLLSLREHTQPWDIYCTQAVCDDLSHGFPVFSILEHFRGVNHHEIHTDQRGFHIPAAAGLTFTAVPLKSEAPPYSPHRHQTVEGDNVGLLVEEDSSGKRFFYAPGLGVIEPAVTHYIATADTAMIDGTMWTDDEMLQAGVGEKRAQEMGHLDQSSPGGILDMLRPMTKPRKILIHINNTNPILNEDSAQYSLLQEEGVELAYDGMNITL